MSQQPASVGIVPNISRTAIYQAFAVALRLYVGRGKRFQYKEVQKGAGVHVRMIEAYKYDPGHEEWREPKIEDVLSIAGFIGPEFTNEILPLIGQGACWLPDDTEPPPGELAADVADDASKIARKAADGRFCNEDRKGLREVGARMAENGMALVAMSRRRVA